jgi:hypothetical protein
MGAACSLVLSVYLVVWRQGDNLQLRFDAVSNSHDAEGASKGAFTLLFTNDLHRSLTIALCLLALLPP